MTFPCATHGAALVTLLKELAAERGAIVETPSSLLYLMQRPECEEPIQRDNLSIEPDDSQIFTTPYVRQEHLVQIIGKRNQVYLGVKISADEALVVSTKTQTYTLVPLVKGRYREIHKLEQQPYIPGAERRLLQKALTQFQMEAWENERELSRPEDRFDPHDEIHFTNTDDGFVELDHVLEEVDTDQQAAQATVMHWFQRRDLMRHQELTELVPVNDGYVAGNNVVHGGGREISGSGNTKGKSFQ